MNALNYTITWNGTSPNGQVQVGWFKIKNLCNLITMIDLSKTTIIIQGTKLNPNQLGINYSQFTFFKTSLNTFLSIEWNSMMRLNDPQPQRVTTTIHISMFWGGGGGGLVCQHSTLGWWWCVSMELFVGGEGGGVVFCVNISDLMGVVAAPCLCVCVNFNENDHFS